MSRKGTPRDKNLDSPVRKPGRPRASLPPEWVDKVIYIRMGRQMVRRVKRDCCICGKTFLAEYHDVLKGRGKYCSIDCRHWGNSGHGYNSAYCACGCGQRLTPCTSRPRRVKRYLFNHQVNLRRLKPEQIQQRREQARVRAANWNRSNPDRKREYRRLNRERINQRRKEYYQTHRQELRLKRQQKHASNPELQREAARRYARKNRLKLNRLKELRRARERNIKGHHTVEQWLARVEFYGWRCRYCRRSLNVKTLTKDHLIPVTRNGTDWASNLVPACQSCNSRKYTRTFKEYVLERAA